MMQPGITDEFRMLCLTGRIGADDEYALVLYGEGVDLGPETTRYLPYGEVTADQVPRGGIRITGRTVENIDGLIRLGWSDVNLDNVTIEPCAGALIINRSHQNAAVAVLVFPHPVSASNGPLRIPLEAVLEWPRQ